MPSLGSPPFLYPIVDTGVCAARSLDPVAVAQVFLDAGARVLQLRVKDLPGSAFLALADRILALTAPYDAALIVNDRADVALLSGAHGVHVGQDDLGVADVRHLVGVHAIVGLSTHDERQVDEALASPATYVAVGPVFGTGTKDTGYTARGLDLVRYAARGEKPVVAIGGITTENARSVVEAGASGLAVITDLVSGDPATRARAFIECI